MRSIAMVVGGVVLGLLAGSAGAQGASENVKRQCRNVSENTARTIVHARSSRIDPATAVKRVPDTWLEGVQAHMLMAASRADYLSESELASIGYSYCIERRPTDAR